MAFVKEAGNVGTLAGRLTPKASELSFGAVVGPDALDPRREAFRYGGSGLTFSGPAPEPSSPRLTFGATAKAPAGLAEAFFGGIANSFGNLARPTRPVPKTLNDKEKAAYVQYGQSRMKSGEVVTAQVDGQAGLQGVLGNLTAAIFEKIGAVPKDEITPVFFGGGKKEAAPSGPSGATIAIVLGLGLAAYMVARK